MNASNENDPNAVRTLLNSLKHTLIVTTLIIAIIFGLYQLFIFFDKNLIFIYEKAFIYIICFNAFLFFCWLIIMKSYHDTDEKYIKTKENFLNVSYVFIFLVIFSSIILFLGFRAYKERYFDCHENYSSGFSYEESCKKKEP